MDVATSSDALGALRRQTSAAHQALEEQMDITNACRTVPRYVALLRSFFGFYFPLESRLRALAGWEDFGFDWTRRAKTPLLEEDLCSLGLLPKELTVLPLCSELPKPESLAAGFGVAYVLEGATLGGRKIVQVLAQSGIPAGAQSFFSSYGGDVGKQWQLFCGMLRQAVAGYGDVQAAAAAAAATFAALSRWLERDR